MSKEAAMIFYPMLKRVFSHGQPHVITDSEIAALGLSDEEEDALIEEMADVGFDQGTAPDGEDLYWEPPGLSLEELEIMRETGGCGPTRK
jgi:hypothetical protein